MKHREQQQVNNQDSGTKKDQNTMFLPKTLDH